MSSTAKDATAGAPPPKKAPAPIDYTAVGQGFTTWFNERVRQLTNPTLQLGTKTATVIALHPDGRLECGLHGESGEEPQHFVAFEAQYLDQLLPRLALLGK